MPSYDPESIILITGEKRVQFHSKGRQQWLVLKRFHGQSVASFINEAIAETQRSQPERFQQGSWWNRELDYCIHKQVIALQTASNRTSLETAVPVAGTTASKTPPQSAQLSGITPGIAGLYLVTLNNAEPISTNAADSRLADRCAKVNRDHCKFGKATDLLRRQRDYEKTFGSENVDFRPLAFLSLQDLTEAEALLKAQLVHYRLVSPAGRRLEWLANIAPQQVIQKAYSTLERSGLVYKLPTQTSASVNN